jgi:tetratricopeptide (TPR) repeat protein
MREGKTAKAEESLKRLLASDPGSPEAHFHLADLYRDTGRAAESLKELEAVYEIDPERTDLRLMMGRAYVEAGDARKAVEILEEAEARGAASENPLVEYFLGDALRRTGQIERGLRHLKAYEDLLREHVQKTPLPVSLNNLAWFLMEDGQGPQRLNEALDLATRAVRSQPSNPYFLGTLGCVSFYLGRYPDALESLEKAISRHTSRADSSTDLFFAAMAAAKIGDRTRALDYLGKGEEIDPRNRYRAQARQVCAVGPLPKKADGGS